MTSPTPPVGPGEQARTHSGSTPLTEPVIRVTRRAETGDSPDPTQPLHPVKVHPVAQTPDTPREGDATQAIPIRVARAEAADVPAPQVRVESPQHPNGRRRAARIVLDPLRRVSTLSPSTSGAGAAVVPSGATRVRGRARSILRASNPPTMPISVRATGDRVSEQHTRAVIDLALRLGEAMLVTGASVADTTAAVLRVARAYGLSSVHADITYTSITISFHRGVYRDPITVMRIVSRFGTDYSRLERLQAMVREIVTTARSNDLNDVQDYLHELEFILEQPHNYRRGIVTAAWAGMGAGVSLLLGGSILMTIIAALTTALIDRVQLKIARWGISAFFGQAIGAAIASTVAVALLLAAEQFPDKSWLLEIRPSVVVASSIVALLAGMSVVTAAQDTLDGFYVTAAARSYEVLLLTAGIVCGVLGVLSIAQKVGVNLYVIPSSQLANSLAQQIVAAAVLAGMFAVSAYCGPRAVLISIATGAISWTLYSFLTALFSLSQPVASGAAVFVVGAYTPLVARQLHVPSIAITAAGLTPLLPGISVYKGIVYFVQDKSGGQTAPTLLTAALVGMGLAAGVSLGTLLGRQLTTEEGSIVNKVLQRTVASE